jgi:hypothetical protein
MLPNLFICLIGLLLAIQGAKSTVIIDPTSCGPYAVTTRTSLDEMVAMIGAAYDRTESAYNLQAAEAELRVVFDTFSAYFSTGNTPATARDLLCMVFCPSPMKCLYRQLTNT